MTMTNKLIIPYRNVEDLDALLATMTVGEEVEEVTIVRIVTTEEAADPSLLIELKGVSSHAQRLPHCHVETRRSITA